ncbi:hypothetical protein ACFL2U_00280 [Patescibacteria group bacterium]
MILRRYSKKQNIIVFMIIGVILFLTSLPYLVGVFLAQDYIFLGGSHLNQGDVHVYLANIEQVKDGKFLTANNFTSEIQKNVFFAPLWIILGWVAKVFFLNSLLVFHLARIIAGLVFLYFLFYYFLDIFFAKFFNKLIAFILICITSGLGLLFKPKIERLIFDDRTIFTNFSVDLVMPEANVFLTLAHSALFIFSQLIILLIFYFVLKNKFQKIELLYVFGFSLLLGFLHTYDVIIVAAVLAVYFLVQFALNFFNKTQFAWQEYLQKVIVILLGFVPALAYFYFVLRPEPTIWGWVEQNVILSPPLRGYIIAYLPLIVFSLLSLYLIRKKILNKKIIFLLCWIITLFVLAYLPFTWQRKLISTVQIALGVLATYGVVFLIKNIIKVYTHKVFGWLVVGILFVFISLSNLSFVVSTIYNYVNSNYVFYFPENYYQAVLWYAKNSSDSQTILSSALNGTVIAGLTGQPVYMGHAHQTINYLEKRELLDNWFFKANQQNEKKKEFLNKYNINYIYYSNREKELGNYNLEVIDWLEQVYDKDDVQIYKVNF